MAEKKLNINDIEKKSKPRFNTMDAFLSELPESKQSIFTDTEIETEILVGSKDSGKSFPIDLYKYYCMERDPMYSGITLQKYSTNAIKRQTRAANNAQTYIKRKFTMQYDYEKKDFAFWMRMKDRKNFLNNQSIEYSSFEDADGLQGAKPSNGGYYGLIHIEEPSQQSDALTGKTITRKEWTKKLKTIKDTLKRSIDDYKETEPFHPPLPFKIFVSTNDWDEEFCVSVDTNKYNPRDEFLDWALGMKYYHLIELYEDKSDGNPIPFLVDWINTKLEDGRTRWEHIKDSVVKNHTKRVRVMNDEFGVAIKTAYTRMTKFANPLSHKNEEKKEDIFNQMYLALITANKTDLARVFGMADDGAADLEKRWNLDKIYTIDSETYLKDRVIFGISHAWDHDANRGPVLTTSVLSGLILKTQHGLNNFSQEPVDLEINVLPQFEIEGHGKGSKGENTAAYHEMMRDNTIRIQEYIMDNFNTRISMPSKCWFDDDDGSYANKFVDWLSEANIDADILPNKNGKIENGGYGREAREKMIEPDMEIGGIKIDKQNKMLLKWFRAVPAVEAEKGKKAITKGMWGKRYKDISDSFFYSLLTFVPQISNGILKKGIE